MFIFSKLSLENLIELQNRAPNKISAELIEIAILHKSILEEGISDADKGEDKEKRQISLFNKIVKIDRDVALDLASNMFTSPALFAKLNIATLRLQEGKLQSALRIADQVNETITPVLYRQDAEKVALYVNDKLNNTYFKIAVNYAEKGDYETAMKIIGKITDSYVKAISLIDLALISVRRQENDNIPQFISLTKNIFGEDYSGLAYHKLCLEFCYIGNFEKAYGAAKKAQALYERGAFKLGFANCYKDFILECVREGKYEDAEHYTNELIPSQIRPAVAKHVKIVRLAKENVQQAEDEIEREKHSYTLDCLYETLAISLVKMGKDYHYDANRIREKIKRGSDIFNKNFQFEMSLVEARRTF